MVRSTPETNASADDQLTACRRRIDLLDQRIVELLPERARINRAGAGWLERGYGRPTA